jgi:transcriptional repressor NrdR
VVCPYCAFDSTRVVDSRLTEPGDAVRRRRECADCGARFTTYERAEGLTLVVRKRDGGREPFDQQKLLGGLLRAATKRPVQLPALEGLVESIAADVRRAGGEASAERIGELALRGLISLDRVAAIRFASVYRNFEDLAQFEAELRRLEAEPVTADGQLPLEGAPSSTLAAGAPSTPIPSGPRGSMGTSPADRSAGAGEGETTRRDHAPHP